RAGKKGQRSNHKEDSCPIPLYLSKKIKQETKRIDMCLRFVSPASTAWRLVAGVEEGVPGWVVGVTHDRRGSGCDMSRASLSGLRAERKRAPAKRAGAASGERRRDRGHLAGVARGLARGKAGYHLDGGVSCSRGNPIKGIDARQGAKNAKPEGTVTDVPA